MSSASVPQPQWQLKYKGTDITANLIHMVTEVSFHDRVGGQVSDIQITVQDVNNRWHTSTYPQPNDTISVYLGYAGAPLLYVGEFCIDEFEFRGPPFTMMIKGIEAWTTAKLRTAKSVNWKGMTFSQIAKTIASEYGYTAIVNADPNQPEVQWDNVVQSFQDQGDMSFLSYLATQNNYVIQVRPPQMIFSSRAVLEKAGYVGPIITPAHIKATHGANFRWQSSAELALDGAINYFFNPYTEEGITGQAKNANPGATSNVLNYSRRFENNQQATVDAAAKLHQNNMWQFQGELTLPGTTAWRTGQVVMLRGWGIFNGRWFIEEADHTLSARAGYATKLVIRSGGTAGNLSPEGLEAANPTYFTP
ncbi:MAG: hypothetical protein KGL39_28135 [Patescibacteria group bacterium]|nr:hypothetical protein [Patescibacteria group bacterium]